MDGHINKMELITVGIECMKHLESLGVDTSLGSMIYDYEPISDNLNECYTLSSYEVSHDDPIYYHKNSVVAFTLQDIFNILPSNIDNCRLESDCKTYIGYNNLISFKGENILKTAYDLLCWVVINKSNSGIII